MNVDISAIEREYAQKRANALKSNELLIKKVYDSSPEIKDIDNDIKKLGIEASRSALSPNSEEKRKRLSTLLEKIETLKNKKTKILNTNGISLEPKYECEKCKDTGYVTINMVSQMCSCMKQKIIDYSYNKFNPFNISNSTFDNFDESLYSGTSNIEKYGTNTSPRDNIIKIKKLSLDFINNFENENTKNMLFIGSAGVGKTFLSGCIANELLKTGHTVLYQTTPLLMDSIFDFKYGSKSKISQELYESLFNVDLLVIDDLGTESQTSAKFAELFTIINTRMLNPKTKTIISTNLDIPILAKLYDDRVMSRLIGNYSICKFFGDDLRSKKGR